MLIRLIGSGLELKEILFYIVIMLFALTLSFSVHEFMHAAVATWLGDDLPGLLGRVTLNPMAHLDPMGTVLLLTVGFGWGKPVVFNPNNLKKFKSKRLMRIMVSLAGVTGNFALALVLSILATIIAGLGDVSNPVISTIIILCSYTKLFSMSLLGFNLLPIPPLDGFHVLEEILPVKLKYTNGYKAFVSYGPKVLMFVCLLGSFSGVSIFGLIMGIIQLPFELIISFICNIIGALF